MRKVLNAAGRVFAVQLLSGSAGIAFGSGTRSLDFLAASDIAAGLATSTDLSAGELRPVVATGLFKSAGDQCFEPVHRQVAEYLGASHFADLIQRGAVSAGRVSATMTSPRDGRVVTDMRGLAAWLGTRSATTRTLLIEADPVGMALYGDVSEWPVADRSKLLESLVERARPEHLWGYTWFDTAEHRYRDAVAWSFRSLCNPDMASEISEFLDAGQLSGVPHHILELLLRALSEAEVSWLDQLHILASRVNQLARDATSPSEVRLAALVALARIEPSESEVEATLGEVLDAIRDGRIADPDDRIGGALLRLLYRGTIPPSRVWAYASLMNRGPAIGDGWHFWRHVLCDETPAGELANLLDGFADDAERLWPILASAFAEELPWRLLVRALREVGRQTEPERLYRWIAAVAVTYERRTTSTDENADLRKWLADNEATTRQLLSIWIVRSADGEVGADEQYFLGGCCWPNAPRT